MLHRPKGWLFGLFVLIFTLLAPSRSPIQAQDPQPAAGPPQLEADLILSAEAVWPEDTFIVTVTVTNTAGAATDDYTYRLKLDEDLLEMPSQSDPLEGELIDLEAEDSVTLQFSLEMAEDAAEEQVLSFKIYDSEEYLAHAIYGRVAVLLEEEPESLITGGPDHPYPWEPGPAAPYSSLFSAAAAYDYPLEVPPGRAGLQPQLALSYSSRASDATLSWRDSSEWGDGWALTGLPFITVHNIHWCGPVLCADTGGGIGDGYRERYMLRFNGSMYEIDGVDTITGTHQVINAPDLHIERTLTNGIDTWRLKTAEGLTYEFGMTEDALQIVLPVAKQNQDYGNYRWFLKRISDLHGNQLSLTYQTVSGPCSHYDPNICREVSVYPQFIRYNNVVSNPDPTDPDDWLTEIEFVWDSLNRQTPPTGMLFYTTDLIEAVIGMCQ